MRLLSDFAILTSAMHMAWLRRIGGRLKSDYRYSIGLVYNTFPMPPEDADLAGANFWMVVNMKRLCDPEKSVAMDE